MNQTDSICQDSSKQNRVSQAQEIYHSASDYILVLWKHRGLLLCGSILPALVFLLFLLLSSKTYLVTYTYNYLTLNNKGFRMIRELFYSSQNLNRIETTLKENGLADQANQINQLKNKEIEYLMEFIHLDVWPGFIGTDGAINTSFEEFEQTTQAESLMVTLTITAKSTQGLDQTATIIRKNFESIIPLYHSRQSLLENLREYRGALAIIEQERFGLNLSLEENRQILEGIQAIKTPFSKAEDAVVLQFDVGDQSEFLPVQYQIQASQAKIVKLEAAINSTEEKYHYFSMLVDLHEKLANEIDRIISSRSTLTQYIHLLSELLNTTAEPNIQNYLKAMIKQTQNKISVYQPVLDSSRIIKNSEQFLQKIMIVFSVAFVISVSIAFFLESIQAAKVRVTSF